MVSVLLELFNLLHGKLETGVLWAFNLRGETNKSSGAAGTVGTAEDARVLVGQTEHLRHAWGSVEEIEEGLLCDVVQVHSLNKYEFPILSRL